MPVSAFRRPCEALGAFKTVKRRMDFMGTANGITVYDDFADHPTAIDHDSRFAPMRSYAFVIVVLGRRIPRLWRHRVYDETSPSLWPPSKQPIQVFVLTVSVAWRVWNVVDALAPLGGRLQSAKTSMRRVADIVKNAEAGDHILVMSSGGLGGIRSDLLRHSMR